jgi:hypothetical protein
MWNERAILQINLLKKAKNTVCCGVKTNKFLNKKLNNKTW